jgi:hypothetical protein
MKEEMKIERPNPDPIILRSSYEKQTEKENKFNKAGF